MVDKSMGDVIREPAWPPKSGWTWTSLRKINYYLQNSHNCTDEADPHQIRRRGLFLPRAISTTSKVRRYGDVPWYDTVIGSERKTC